MISGAWAVPLFLSNGNFGEIRQRAAKLQKTEQEAPEHPAQPLDQGAPAPSEPGRIRGKPDGAPCSRSSTRSARAAPAA